MHASSLTCIEDQVYIFAALFYNFSVSAHSRVTVIVMVSRIVIIRSVRMFAIMTLLLTLSHSLSLHLTDIHHFKIVFVPSCSGHICKNMLLMAEAMNLGMFSNLLIIHD